MSGIFGGAAGGAVKTVETIVAAAQAAMDFEDAVLADSAYCRHRFILQGLKPSSTSHFSVRFNTGSWLTTNYACHRTSQNDSSAEITDDDGSAIDIQVSGSTHTIDAGGHMNGVVEILLPTLSRLPTLQARISHATSVGGSKRNQTAHGLHKTAAALVGVRFGWDWSISFGAGQITHLAFEA